MLLARSAAGWLSGTAGCCCRQRSCPCGCARRTLTRFDFRVCAHASPPLIAGLLPNTAAHIPGLDAVKASRWASAPFPCVNAQGAARENERGRSEVAQLKAAVRV